jgi:hypothetical protein
MCRVSNSMFRFSASRKSGPRVAKLQIDDFETKAIRQQFVDGDIVVHSESVANSLRKLTAQKLSIVGAVSRTPSRASL